MCGVIYAGEQYSAKVKYVVHNSGIFYLKTNQIYTGNHSVNIDCWPIGRQPADLVDSVSTF